MGVQETLSVNMVTEFCAQTEYLDGSAITSNDRIPIWDGYILYFAHKGLRITGSEVKIPVQIKGKKCEGMFSDENKPLTYSIEITHINDFFADGGILYIVVAIDESFNKRMYAKILLPVDIIDLRRGKENQKTIAILLNSVETPHDLVMLCSLFAENKAKQSILIKSKPEMGYRDVSHLEFSFIPSKNVRDPSVAFLTAKSSYCYSVQNGIPIPFLGESFVIARECTYRVSCGSLFDEVIPGRRIDKKESITLIISEIATITINHNESKFNIRVEVVGQPPLKKVLQGARALLAFHESKTLMINGKNIGKTASEKLQGLFSEPILSFLTSILKAGVMCNEMLINTESITVKDIFTDFSAFSSLAVALRHGTTVHLNTMQTTGIFCHRIGTKVIYLSYKKDHDQQYMCYNYLEDTGSPDIGIFVNVNGEMVRINKWLVINVENIANALIDKSKMIDALQTISHPVEYSKVIWYILELIHAFDRTENEEFLHFALRLSNLLPESTEKTVNEQQINSRLRQLSPEEKTIVMKLKITESTMAKCCASVLLDQKDEYQTYFSALTEMEQEQFCTWPIYTLAQRKGLL